MSTPSEREKRLCEMFDSYCKSVLGNTSKYLLRKMATHAQREEIHDPDVIIDLLPQKDEYPSDRFIVFADELTCEVHSETVYQALMSMPEKQRKVLILDFWHDWQDKQIQPYGLAMQ
jgi:DNA-directed RNA polymerase specialized sigma24 family protein